MERKKENYDGRMDSILFYFLFYTNYFLENDLVEK